MTDAGGPEFWTEAVRGVRKAVARIVYAARRPNATISPCRTHCGTTVSTLLHERDVEPRDEEHEAALIVANKTRISED